MTVAELIAKLQAMPQNVPVLTYEDRYGYLEPEPEVDTVRYVKSDQPFAPDYYFAHPGPDDVAVTVVTL